LGEKPSADDEEVETEERKGLRQQSKDYYAARFDITSKEMGQVFQCWWRICQEINVLSQVGISHILYLFVTYLQTRK
jgi:hypothetical protein